MPTATTTELDLTPIESMLAAATPGPWGWFGYLKHNSLYLATQHGGRKYVMCFKRWGMAFAQPLFQSEKLMRTIPELAERGEIAVKGYGASEVVGVSHPDMVLIEKAPEVITKLLAEVKRLRSERDGAAGTELRHPDRLPPSTTPPIPKEFA